MTENEVSQMPLRCRLTVEDAAELRALLELEGAAGRVRWPGATPLIPGGHPAEAEVAIRASSESVVLRGSLEERSEGDGFGIWLNVPGAKALLESHFGGASRHFRRQPIEYLAIVSGPANAHVLCRVRDLGEGGARIIVSGEDAGPEGSEVSVEILDAVLQGTGLLLKARVAWGRKNEVGVEWTSLDSQGRGSLAHLLRGAADAGQLAQAG